MMKQGTSTSSCKSFSLQFVTFRNNCWKKWWYVESVPYEKYRIELSRPLGFSYQHDTTSVFLQVWSVIIHHVNLPRLLSMVKVLLRWKGFESYVYDSFHLTFDISIDHFIRVIRSYKDDIINLISYNLML